MALTKVTSNLTSFDSLLVDSDNTNTSITIESDLDGSSLFTSGIDLRREGVSKGSRIESLRDASAGGVGLNFLTTADNAAEVSGTLTSRMVILESGEIGIGTSSPTVPLQINHSSSGIGLYTLGAYNYQAKFESSDAEAAIVIEDSNSTNDGNRIGVITNDMTFITNNSERMRITSTGSVYFGVTSDPSGSVGGSGFLTDSAGRMNLFLATTTTGAADIANFHNPNGMVGRIIVDGSSTSYNTSSDYRLKENVVTDWDATTRLKQLRPSRFNFIADADTTVDGFLAHEVSDIVPEAISGEKDATETLSNVVLNSDNQIIAEDISEDDWTAGKTGDDAIYPSDSTWEASHTIPVYQGIDQAKLVPLLVKTIQELEARITTLENA